MPYIVTYYIFILYNIPSGWPEEASERPPVFEEVSEHLNRHQPQEHMFALQSEQPSGHLDPRAHVRCRVQTELRWLQTMKKACNRSDARARTSRRDNWKLIKKHVRPCDLKSVAACCPDTHLHGSDTAHRTPNQSCIRFSKAYI
jgi:hypothetical protein